MDQFEEPEKEFTLKAESDTSSTSSEDSIDKDEEKPSVESRSVRTKPVQTSLDGDSPGSSQRSSPQGSLAGMVLSRPVTVRQLGATIREPGYIESEFRKLPSPVVSSDDVPPGAERKNRYSNVVPTPKTRVPLKLQFGRPNSDYINGNFIRGYKNAPRQYIATQGPMDNTIEDFWRMCWENNVEVIVMATNFQERGIDKCARYWPAQGSEEYGNIEVTLVQQTAHQTHSASNLHVRDLGVENSEVRTVRHYRLTCWPHQGVPRSSKQVTDFLREVKMADSAGPSVVHCSAGIGRTGCLIAIDIGIQGILQGDPKIDILRIVSTMRQDRAGMVQTRDQYRFIHQALYDVAREVGPQQ